jgi:hypothetical protein
MRCCSAPCVLSERSKTDGRVTAAGCVETERFSTHGRVIVGFVVSERTTAHGRVTVADSITTERKNTGGRVAGAGRVVQERTSTASSGRDGPAKPNFSLTLNSGSGSTVTARSYYL